MAISEFRYNKRRKHYSYIFKKVGHKYKNMLFTSKPNRKDHLSTKKNISLYRHPNPDSAKQIYVIPIIYYDDLNSFDSKKLNWMFDKNDKRKIKRIKKRKKKK